jgi:hypothetical protein
MRLITGIKIAEKEKNILPNKVEFQI